MIRSTLQSYRFAHFWWPPMHDRVPETCWVPHKAITNPTIVLLKQLVAFVNRVSGLDPNQNVDIFNKLMFCYLGSAYVDLCFCVRYLNIQAPKQYTTSSQNSMKPKFGQNQSFLDSCLQARRIICKALILLQGWFVFCMFEDCQKVGMVAIGRLVWK